MTDCIVGNLSPAPANLVTRQVLFTNAALITPGLLAASGRLA